MVDIAATLIHWYAENKRELPWRETTDPYRIWISEIILIHEPEANVAAAARYMAELQGH